MRMICLTCLALPLCSVVNAEPGDIAFHDVTLLCAQKQAFYNSVNSDGTLDREDAEISQLKGRVHHVFDVDEEAGKIRQFSTIRRTLFREYPFRKWGDIYIGRYDFADGPGGAGVVLNLDNMTYIARMDFGGRTGAYVTNDRTGTCKLVTGFADLPPTSAMAAGIPDDEVGSYYAEQDVEIAAWRAENQQTEVPKESGASESIE